MSICGSGDRVGFQPIRRLGVWSLFLGVRVCVNEWTGTFGKMWYRSQHAQQHTIRYEQLSEGLNVDVCNQKGKITKLVMIQGWNINRNIQMYIFLSQQTFSDFSWKHGAGIFTYFLSGFITGFSFSPTVLAFLSTLGTVSVSNNNKRNRGETLKSAWAIISHILTEQWLCVTNPAVAAFRSRICAMRSLWLRFTSTSTLWKPREVWACGAFYQMQQMKHTPGLKNAD